jgi:hypothetical protein
MKLVALGWAMAAPEGVDPVRVEFVAPDGCSSADAFYAGMRARTDRVRRAQAGESALDVRVRLSRKGTRVFGELRSFENGSPTETRAVDGATCDEVVDALSFTAALAIDPNARFAPGTAKPEETDTGSTARTETRSKSDGGRGGPPRRRLPERDREELDRERSESLEPELVRPRERHRLELGVQLSGLEVLSSELGMGAALFLRLSQKGHALVDTSFGLGLLHVRNDLFTGPDRVSAHWTGVVLSACPLRFNIADGLTFTPCAVGMAGTLHARGRNLSNPESANRSWWSLGGTVRGATPLGTDVALEFEVGLTRPLVRRRFVTRLPDETVGQTPEIAPVGGFGVSHAF